MGIRHYGLDPETARFLQLLCRSDDDGIRSMVREACTLSNDALSRAMYRSLTEGRSFADLCKENYVPATPEDFYGYRRKALAIFGNMYLKRLMPKKGK